MEKHHVRPPFLHGNHRWMLQSSRWTWIGSTLFVCGRGRDQNEANNRNEQMNKNPLVLWMQLTYVAYVWIIKGKAKIPTSKALHSLFYSGPSLADLVLLSSALDRLLSSFSSQKTMPQLAGVSREPFPVTHSKIPFAPLHPIAPGKLFL